MLAPSLLEASNKHSTDRWTNLPPISTNFKDSTKQKLLLGGIRNFPTNWAILRGKQICMTTHKRFETISKHNNIVGVDIKATKQSKKCLKTKAKQFVDQILLLMLSISWNSSDATSGMIKKICHNFFMFVGCFYCKVPNAEIILLFTDVVWGNITQQLNDETQKWKWGKVTPVDMWRVLLKIPRPLTFFWKTDANSWFWSSFIWRPKMKEGNICWNMTNSLVQVCFCFWFWGLDS